MREFSSWSIGFGRWAGVEVRLHAFFLAFGALAVYFSTLPPEGANTFGALCLLVLLGSIVLHEVAHCLAAIYLGGIVDQLVIGPFGGLAPVRVPGDPRREAMAILAGPVANLALFVPTSAALALLQENPLSLLNPFAPEGLTEPSLAMATLKLVCWVNWLLFWVNLLPAFPLDGGPALKAWLTPSFGHPMATMLVVRCAKLTAIGLCILAWVVHNQFESSPVPTWLPLILLAIVVFFSARVETEQMEAEEAEDDLLGYDFSQGYTSLERQLDPPVRHVRPSKMRRWLEMRRAARRRRMEALELEEELRFDEILARIHVEGMKSITAEERNLLDRVSARYRSRQSQ